MKRELKQIGVVVGSVAVGLTVAFVVARQGACSVEEEETANTGQALGSGEPTIEYDGSVFDIPPDDPRQYDGSLCSTGGPPLIGAQAWLDKYGCESTTLHTPIGFYEMPDGSTQCRGAFLYRAQWEAENEAVTCANPPTNVQWLSCSAPGGSAVDYCSTNASPATTIARQSSSLVVQQSLCVDATVFARLKYQGQIKGSLGLNVFGCGINTEHAIVFEAGFQASTGGRWCLHKNKDIRVDCGGRDFEAGALSCNSYWEHKDIQYGMFVTKVTWPEYRSCALNIDGNAYAYKKTKIDEHYMETTAYEQLPQSGDWSDCHGCRPGDNGMTSAQSPNCMATNQDGIWGPTHTDGAGHLIASNTPKAGGSCVHNDTPMPTPEPDPTPEPGDTPMPTPEPADSPPPSDTPDYPTPY